MMIFGLCLGNRAFPRFFRARVLSVAYYRVSRPAYLFLHRCPQLKSIGVGFGALLPGVRSHVRCSSFDLKLLCPTCDRGVPPPHSYSISKTSKDSRCGSNLPFTRMAISI